MGLSQFPEAWEGGVILFIIIHAALFMAMVRGILICILRKVGFKVYTEPPELAETLWSYAYAEEEASELDSGLAQFAMTAEAIEDRLPVTLFEASSSSSSCSDGDNNGVCGCVVCLRKFHGGEEIRSLPCGHVFHRNCVDKWVLDYENMACPLCRLSPVVNVPAEDDGSYLTEELVM
uniref:RING-type domain-containing protein n=1 Tax=Picea sitchensis TaxID=3332 RepID=A9P0Y9_PICSI|nr:unknown [Picea sitchensis]